MEVEEIREKLKGIKNNIPVTMENLENETNNKITALGFKERNEIL